MDEKDITEQETIPSCEEAIEVEEQKENDYLDQLLRIKAEFDNYRKRTTKEREKIYDDAVNDTVLAFLPAIDNLERAHISAMETQPDDGLTEGVGLVIKQVMAIFSQLKVFPI